MNRAARLKAIEAREQAATKGPWKAELDEFDCDEGLVATVCDPLVKMLACIATEIIDVPDPEGPWTDEKAAVKRAAWEKAKQSQELVDAAFIAESRADVPWLLEQLRLAEAVIEAARNEFASEEIDLSPNRVCFSDALATYDKAADDITKETPK